MPITDFELMEAPEIKKAFKKVGAVLGRSSIITSPDALEELQGAVTQLVRTAYEFGEDSSVAAFAAALDVPLPKGLS